MLKVDLVGIPTPTTYKVSINTVTKSERSANNNADINIEYVATKRKVELTWSYLSSANYADLLNRVKRESTAMLPFEFEYPDPKTGAMRTSTFYAGDPSAEAIDYQGGIIRWKSVSINFIEI